MAVLVLVEVGLDVAVLLGVALIVGVAVLVGVAVRVEVAVEVAVGPPFCTVTVTAAVPSVEPELLSAFAEIVWLPLVTVVEFQLKVKGGVEAK